MSEPINRQHRLPQSYNSAHPYCQACERPWPCQGAYDALEAQRAEAVASERQRIAAAVERMLTDNAPSWVLDRAAVLRIVEGE